MNTTYMYQCCHHLLLSMSKIESIIFFTKLLFLLLVIRLFCIFWTLHQFLGLKILKLFLTSFLLHCVYLINSQDLPFEENILKCLLDSPFPFCSHSCHSNSDLCLLHVCTTTGQYISLSSPRPLNIHTPAPLCILLLDLT